MQIDTQKLRRSYQISIYMQVHLDASYIRLFPWHRLDVRIIIDETMVSVRNNDMHSESDRPVV